MSKRRPNGDGMVRKRPDGRWEAFDETEGSVSLDNAIEWQK